MECENIHQIKIGDITLLLSMKKSPAILILSALATSTKWLLPLVEEKDN